MRVWRFWSQFASSGRISPILLITAPRVAIRRRRMGACRLQPPTAMPISCRVDVLAVRHTVEPPVIQGRCRVERAILRDYEGDAAARAARFGGTMMARFPPHECHRHRAREREADHAAGSCSDSRPDGARYASPYGLDSHVRGASRTRCVEAFRRDRRQRSRAGSLAVLTASNACGAGRCASGACPGRRSAPAYRRHAGRTAALR